MPHPINSNLYRCFPGRRLANETSSENGGLDFCFFLTGAQG